MGIARPGGGHDQPVERPAAVDTGQDRALVGHVYVARRDLSRAGLPGKRRLRLGQPARMVIAYHDRRALRTQLLADRKA